jgi:nitrite reductase/ring-hydroxylating ferredoxin subunit
MADDSGQLTRVADLDKLRQAGCLTAHANGHTLALFAYGERVYAVDNRCPHMGFPLSQGSVKDGILTCHWHHARFDLASGGAFDLFADDVATFPVEVRDGGVWVDLRPRSREQVHAQQTERLRDGLERDIPLVIAKAVLVLADQTQPEPAAEPLRIGLDFGTRYRESGWGQGLTILACMSNLLPALEAEDRPRALYHGLSAVARDSFGAPPRFMVRPLPGAAPGMPTLKRWFRQFVEVRDAEGAERAIISAVRPAAGPGQAVPAEAQAQIADMLFSAVSDHRYIDTGHRLDFTNKALEALDAAGWEAERAEQVLSSLAPGYVNAARMEESNAWRHPVDLVALLESAFEALPAALETGAASQESGRHTSREQLANLLLDDDPAATVAQLLAELRAGRQPADLAGDVAYAAALRILRFPVSNEFTDWDTALHTFTFANAVHQGLRRCASAGLVRAVFDAAMSVYLDRFLNVPAAPLPQPGQQAAQASAEALGELPKLLDRQQQVEAAAAQVAGYLYTGGAPDRLMKLMGKLLLREDRDFHTIQTIEAAFRQHSLLHARAPHEAAHVLIAAARYLAAHSPSMRAQGQTYQIALRLSRGERLFEG